MQIEENKKYLSRNGNKQAPDQKKVIGRPRRVIVSKDPQKGKPAQE